MTFFLKNTRGSISTGFQEAVTASLLLLVLVPLIYLFNSETIYYLTNNAPLFAYNSISILVLSIFGLIIVVYSILGIMDKFKEPDMPRF